MSELSPAAQAVLDAYRSSHLSIDNLAAALRAAADQLMERTPRVDVGIGWPCNELHAIADEIEAQ